VKQRTPLAKGKLSSNKQLDNNSSIFEIQQVASISQKHCSANNIGLKCDIIGFFNFCSVAVMSHEGVMIHSQTIEFPKPPVEPKSLTRVATPPFVYQII